MKPAIQREEVVIKVGTLCATLKHPPARSYLKVKLGQETRLTLIRQPKGSQINYFDHANFLRKQDNILQFEIWGIDQNIANLICNGSHKVTNTEMHRSPLMDKVPLFHLDQSVAGYFEFTLVLYGSSEIPAKSLRNQA